MAEGTQMKSEKLYEAASPYGDDVLALPVQDIDRTVQWYGNAFGLSENCRILRRGTGWALLLPSAMTPDTVAAAHPLDRASTAQPMWLTR